MSPLATHINGKNPTFPQGSPVSSAGDDAARLLAPVEPSKVTYSVSDLYGLRHNKSESPNSGNRMILASISRQSITPSSSSSSSSSSTTTFRSAFSLNIMAETLERAQRDRRRHQANSSGQMYNGRPSYDRSRQSNFARGPPNGTNNCIQVRLQLKQDVKLSEAENAWKPSFLQKSTENNDATELYKQVRSILNKLTAQNFAILTEQFKNLKIDTKEKLVEVINLVFNKAVNEPNFSECYAKLSEYLSQCSKQFETSGESAYFKRTLITKCQMEFEQHVANKNATDAALEPLMAKLTVAEKNGDKNGVTEIKTQITEEESVLRRRLVSTVRFIGELYKLDMLTTNIMNVCISVLVREITNAQPNKVNQANEKLECLCKLLTTVGGKLERKPDATNNTKSSCLDLSTYMNQLTRIAENKLRNFKPNTRIKFMVLDVIELRNNRWMPRITNAALQQAQAQLARGL